MGSMGNSSNSNSNNSKINGQMGALAGLWGKVKGARKGCLIAIVALFLTLFLCVAIAGAGIWLYWPAPADPTQQITAVRPGEHEHSSLDRCPAGLEAHATKRGMVCR